MTNSTRVDCSFCEESLSGLLFDPILASFGAPRFNRTVWQNETLFIVPSLGPITDTHFMVVSKKHHHSIRDAPEGLRNEACNVARQVADMLPLSSGSSAVIFEHGSPASCSSDHACVDHLHVHVLTAPNQVIEACEHAVVQISGIQLTDFDKIAVTSDYIFFEVIDGERHILESDLPQRQFIRSKLLSCITGNVATDWRDQPDFDRVREMMTNINFSSLHT